MTIVLEPGKLYVHNQGEIMRFIGMEGPDGVNALPWAMFAVHGGRIVHVPPATVLREANGPTMICTCGHKVVFHQLAPGDLYQVGACLVDRCGCQQFVPRETP